MGCPVDSENAARLPEVAPLPPEAPISPLWSAYRRRVLLLSLVTGLAVFLLWLPGTARAALWRALFAQRALVGMLFLFALVILSLLWSAGQRLDAKIFLHFNLRGYHARWMDRLMWLATQLGNIATATAFALLFLLLHYRRLAVEIVLGTITLWLCVETVKVLTDRTRPFHVLDGARVIGWREPGRSFPSGHTAQTFFLTTLLINRFQPGLGGTVALYAVAALVGFTRMYVGAHYPRDVIGGAVLGSIWGVVAMLVDPFLLGLRF